ncbi:MAG TPA: 2-oxoglutarate dehydrogenase, E2 component, dihydrolipoamide succinyltransferase [Bryobacteraceae bacterium]|jgi:2-oxoglutarate dehydrogenase E2 component (dihydrolipoamide succinyltransferase)|nr:2-oxoglutarate dehydrogenase, E2 component, dihydrolipoamide succinyltransferase [Bryobacteraceae bacterium]
MTDVVMPQMGESIVEGTLTKWLKKTGDKVERDEPLFEISTDKVDTEIPSPAAGTLGELLVQEGQTVQVNAIVARINEGGSNGSTAAAPSPAPAAAAPPPPVQEKAAAPARTEGPAAAPPAQAPAPTPETPSGPLSPLVRRMARENNIDLTKVTGTGAGGRITKEDLEALLKQPAAATAAPAAPAAPVKAPSSVVPAVPVGQARPTAKARVEPMSNMRVKIAEHMVMSKRVSAHVTTVHRVDMTRVAKMRAKHKEDFAARYGMSLTFLPFVARATVEALSAFPIVNASIDGTNIIYHNEINLGIAVALDNGLIVPVIRAADEKNVVGLQRSIVDLASRARARQLKPDEIQGGTFSITNFGSFGSVFATPIINQPQVGILGVGAVEKVPVVIDDAIAIRSQCYLALTFDHRLIDGALGDQFTAKVKSVLENWSEDVL